MPLRRVEETLSSVVGLRTIAGAPTNAPLSGYVVTSGIIWDGLGVQTWDNWTLPWGSGATTPNAEAIWDNLGTQTWDNWTLTWGT